MASSDLLLVERRHRIDFGKAKFSATWSQQLKQHHHHPNIKHKTGWLVRRYQDFGAFYNRLKGHVGNDVRTYVRSVTSFETDYGKHFILEKPFLVARHAIGTGAPSDLSFDLAQWLPMETG